MRTKKRAPARPSNPDTRRLFKQAAERGWQITGGGNQHYRMLCPNPCKCTYMIGASISNQLFLTRARTFLNRHTCWNGETI